MGAGWDCLLHIPAVNVPLEEVGVRDTGDLTVELEVAGIHVTPTGVVLIETIVFAADFNGMAALHQRQNVAHRVDSLPENGIDISVAADSASQVVISTTLVNRHSRENVRWS